MYQHAEWYCRYIEVISVPRPSIIRKKGMQGAIHGIYGHSNEPSIYQKIITRFINTISIKK